ncbi:nucleoside hydrolase-like [Saccoglossus kowalevskii]|uniref:Inosine-uridine preferring nucleoside hydrolase-like n=1 Tax=Saccoglossus kowalevskii TaxID=10224 RepID=A0ABM0M6F0_SACKO|nr:PREDICTED: inosine-uridine preferring nucleoside hydrolase-like [Saccoglossus kowalevskii]
MGDGKLLMVIDCDAGIDDAQAIMIALSQPHVKILAITCVLGNISSTNQVCLNVLRILKVCGKLGKIPVHRGAEKYILPRHSAFDSTGVHGDDGLGDTPDPNAPDDSHIESKHGVNALIDLVRQHPGQLTLVALGPLTNLALAARLDSEFSKNIKELILMGGNTAGRGNITISAEFNFYADPEAAQIVLNDFDCPVYINGWELSIKSAIEWTWYKQYLETKTRKAEFLKIITRKRIHDYEFKLESFIFQSKDLFLNYGWNVPDAVAMMVAIDRRAILEMEQRHATVELNGTYSRGQMVVDWADHLPNRKISTIVTKIDMGILMAMMSKSIE